MVPQKRYKPYTSSDRRRYVDEFNIEPSIDFYMQKPDEEGISLKDALHGRFARLVARDEPMFREPGPSISIRISVSISVSCTGSVLVLTMLSQWPGYQPWSRQIPTRDFRNPPGPISRAKLAKNVAKSVARFIVVRINSIHRDSCFTVPFRNTKDVQWRRTVTLFGSLVPIRSTFLI